MQPVLKDPVILKDFDPAELELIEDIQKNCHKLHMMPPPVLKLEMKVIQGGTVTAVYRDLSRSWVRNYYNWIMMQTMGLGYNALGTTFGAGGLTPKRTNGSDVTGLAFMLSARYGSDYASGYHIRAGAGVTDYGIVVGTSTAAETFEGYALDALIANGSGAGQMGYAAMDANLPTWDGGTKKFTQEIIRYINNNSGGSITVNEAAIYCSLYYSSPTTASQYYFMLARDLLAAGVAVAATAQLQVKYTVQSPAFP